MVAYNLLKEAENILQIQIVADNYYAKRCIDRVEKDLKEVEAMQEEINRDLRILNSVDAEEE